MAGPERDTLLTHIVFAAFPGGYSYHLYFIDRETGSERSGSMQEGTP